MKAMIFAAGIGSRLKEVTLHTPKCLVQADGKTMLHHTIEHLCSAGVTSVMINIHHHAEQIRAEVLKQSNFGIDIEFSFEESLLDTGGGLKNVADFFQGSEPFITHNADIYSDCSLQLLVKQHVESNAVATLGVMQRPSKRGLYFDSDMKLTGWTEEKSPKIPPSGSLFAFSGMAVFSPKVFNYMPHSTVFSLIEPCLNAARSNQKVNGSVINGDTWVDIGTPETLEKLRNKLRTKDSGP